MKRSCIFYLPVGLLSVFMVLCSTQWSPLTNAALFHYFLFMFTSLSLFISFAMVPQRRLFISRPLAYVFLWGIYIVFHTLSVGQQEWYQGSYCIGGLLFLVALVHWISQGCFTFKQLSVLFLVVGVFQSVVCLLQSVGILPPVNELFEVSGTWSNPNITAMYIVLTLPFIVVFGSRRVFMWGCVFCMVAALIVLQCRTAYVGLFTMFLLYIASRREILFYIKSLSRFTKISLLFTLVSLFIAGSIGLYQLKKDSADGRLFVWKITSRMIATEPLSGYGYGLFTKHYNLSQASYFENQEGSVTEKQNARYVYSAYNEYLEQTAKGGIIGGFFFISFFLWMLYRAHRSSNRVLLLVGSAATVMGLVNFIQAAIPVWILLLSVAAFAFAEDKKMYHLKWKPSCVLYGCASLSLFPVCFMFVAQRQLVCSTDKHIPASDKLSTHVTTAGSSDIFLCTYARILISEKRYKEALSVLLKAEKYTASPSLFRLKATCLKKLNNPEGAFKQMQRANYMVPDDVDTKFQLLMLAKDLNKRDRVEDLCRQLLAEKKPHSKKVDYYQQIARSLLKRKGP